MATVLAGTSAQNPATLYPNLYSSCFWNFVTGWQCETIPTQPSPVNPSAPPVSSNPVVSPSAPSNLALASGMKNCGCCGGSAASSPTAPTPLMLAGSAASLTTAKPCGCGCKGNGPSWLAVLSALVLAVVAIAALSES